MTPEDAQQPDDAPQIAAGPEDAAKADLTPADAVTAEPAADASAGSRFSRRGVFASAGVAAAVGLAGAAGGYAASEYSRPEEAIALTYPFRGDHQAGILTPAQDNMFTAAFDITTDNLERLTTMLAEWTLAAEQMAAGELIGGEPSANKQAAPRDSGEAWGYKPNGLTITFGLGKGLFVDAKGRDRFGLAAKMPTIVKEGMPVFPHEQIRAGDSDGDLLIQACSNDPQVCLHAIRNLARIGFGTASIRWSQIGYGRTSSTSVEQETPRNLFGFKDGTNNMKAEDQASELNEHLWVQAGDDPAADWLAGGTYFVSRKIHMFSEIWDRLRLIEQEQIFGRDKRFGAPLSISDPREGKQEFTAVDYAAKGEDGEPLVPADSHIAVVSPEQNNGRRMLRRGYNFTEGTDSLGRLQTGLFFVAFVRDPRTNFYPILKRMSSEDALDEYLQHRARSVFAIPAGIGKGARTFADALFA